MRLTRRLLLFAAILGALFFGANVAAERIAEDRIASEAQKSFGTKEKPSVSIEGFPILINLLQGRIPRASLDGENLTVQDLDVARFHIALEGIETSISDLTSGAPISIRRGLAQATVTSTAVTAYVRSRDHDVDIEILSGAIRVSGRIRGVGAGVAEGTPKLVGRLLQFVPDRVTVEGRELRPPALNAARRELSFEVDVPPLPGGVRITSIDYHPGEARLIARLENGTIDLSEKP